MRMCLEIVVPKTVKKVVNACDGAHFCKVVVYARKQLPFLRAHVNRFFHIFDLVIAGYILNK